MISGHVIMVARWVLEQYSNLLSGVFIYIAPFVLFDGMYVLNKILYYVGILRMLAKWICWQIVKFFPWMFLTEFYILQEYGEC
jgi:hypothetical protein